MTTQSSNICDLLLILAITCPFLSVLPFLLVAVRKTNAWIKYSITVMPQSNTYSLQTEITFCT